MTKYAIWDKLGQLALTVVMCSLVFGIGKDPMYLILVPFGAIAFIVALRQLTIMDRRRYHRVR